MSAYFRIKGGKPLFGTVKIYGSKNAALPILTATLLTKEPCTLRNIPRVSDVHLMIDALKEMGSQVIWKDLRTIIVNNRNINPKRLNPDMVKKMRASILFCGPLLARFGQVRAMQYPGGCSIGPRPIDVHLRAFEDLGAKVVRGKKHFSIYLRDDSNQDATIVLEEFSVTATENVMMLASGRSAKTVIKIAAAEPHVADLAKFLSRMGAKIEGRGTPQISVRGLENPYGAQHKIISDYIEAGTFILLALTVGGEIQLKNVPLEHLDLVVKKLRSAGADIVCDVKTKSVVVRRGNQRLALACVQTMPHPGIPTDLQSAFGVFATQTRGKTLIHEPLYEKRLDCLTELAKMNALVKILDPHRAIVDGPTRLKSAEVIGSDLRSAAALIIAGLAAKGTTIVYGAEHAERGYENLEGRLRALGANITKIF